MLSDQLSMRLESDWQKSRISADLVTNAIISRSLKLTLDSRGLVQLLSERDEKYVVPSELHVHEAQVEDGHV